MIPGIIAFFQALPALLELLNRLGLVMDRLVKYANQNNLNSWVNDLEKQIDNLEKAKTADEKLQAAKGLVDIVHNLGPK